MSRILHIAAASLLFIAPAAAAPDARIPSPGAGESVGLYPLQLPAGQEALEPRLLGQLHDGAATLPRLRAFDLIPRGVCAPDEGGCLAAAARSARLSQMVSGQVESTPKGYKFTLRLFAAKDGALLEQHAATVDGGPLDLAGGLEHGICTLLGAAPCAGQLIVRTEAGAAGARLFVDGQDQGVLPLAKPLSLPVGRHLVKAGADERRVRVSYQRDTKLLCAQRAGATALLDDVPDAPSLQASALAAPSAPGAALATNGALLGANAAPDAATEVVDPRTRTGRLLLAGGAALLASAAGLEWYARAQASALDSRYRAGQLTDADKPSYGHVTAAGVAAIAAGAVGLGALAVGGFVLFVAPSGAAVQGRF